MLKRLILAKVLWMPHFIVSDVVAVTWTGFSSQHLTDSNDAHCEKSMKGMVSVCTNAI
jgi:hypothetical protein